MYWHFLFYKDIFILCENDAGSQFICRHIAF